VTTGPRGYLGEERRRAEVRVVPDAGARLTVLAGAPGVLAAGRLLLAGAAVAGLTAVIAAALSAPSWPGVAPLYVLAAAVPLGWAVVEVVASAAGRRRQALDSELRLARLASSVATQRDALEERDHDVLSALVAVEGGLRALRAAPADAATAAVAPALLLLDALAVEVSTARGLLAPAGVPAASEPFELADLLRAQVDVERARGTRIEADLPTSLPAAASATRTAQVVRNLLDNARRHAPGATVHVRARRERDAVVVRIRDDGPGIPAAERRQVFARQGRGRAAGPGGSGLGLFVAARLTAEQGGELRLEDGAAGASFVLRLPAAPAPARTREVPA
jgi:signal transduction histidine kinase